MLSFKRSPIHSLLTFRLILIVAIFFGTLWLISFYYGEKKVNFEDYMQAKLSKRYSRELSPLELNVPTHQERVDQLRLPY